MRLPSGGIGFCLLVSACLGCASLPIPASAAVDIDEEANPELLAMLPPLAPPSTVEIDRSGRRQRGEATYYAESFGGKKMANGEKLRLTSDVAASKSLPFGTIARVTNLRNGKSVVVQIQDRGPFRKGRVVDLTPAVAERLDIKKSGFAPVVVSPISVPQEDGSLKLGAGASLNSPVFDAAEAARKRPAPWH